MVEEAGLLWTHAARIALVGHHSGRAGGVLSDGRRSNARLVGDVAEDISVDALRDGYLGRTD